LPVLHGQQRLRDVFHDHHTTDQDEALKVRLLEGYNGRDVQDFNLYLSSYDYCVGAAVDCANGGATIFTNDNSCAVPKLPTASAAALAFTTTNFDGTRTQGADGGPTDISHMREGHVEIIEMGTVLNSSAAVNAITHVHGSPVLMLETQVSIFKQPPGGTQTLLLGSRLFTRNVAEVEFGNGWT
jgi:hypothetical protein